jgi:peptidoglycan biosynthesis protein MviN/MurJ (putative lipid II flippase)
LRKRAGLIAVACLIMGAVLWAAAMPLGEYFTGAYRIEIRMTALILLVASGGLVYFAAAQLTGALNAKTLWRAMRRG